ncbi:hypothetical protein Leryth_006905 [Lithospermum erythrorhizon]|nr:hypothetical protein Leryth_006905 [Lithospermum erythrorhizon]
MDETPSPSSTSRNGSTTRNGRKIQQRHAAEEEDGVDPIKCTGKSCKSCTAGVIADCVAVCCCPCAVVDILAFTFLKIPYLMGRRWLTKGRMKMVKKKNRKERPSAEDDERGVVVMGGINGNSRKVREEVALENEVMELGNEELKDNFSAEEDVWLELYRIGHLGFGRVSFSTSGFSFSQKITSS